MAEDKKAWTASDELDEMPVGTAEEERARAKAWMDTAATHCRNEAYWRKRAEASESTDVKCPRCGETVPEWFMDSIEHGGIFQSLYGADTQETVMCEACLYSNPYPSSVGATSRKAYDDVMDGIRRQREPAKLYGPPPSLVDCDSVQTDLQEEAIVRPCPWCRDDVNLSGLSPRIMTQYPFNCPGCGKRIVACGSAEIGSVLKIVGVACE